MSPTIGRLLHRGHGRVEAYIALRTPLWDVEWTLECTWSSPLHCVQLVGYWNSELPGETLLERLQNGRFVELFETPVDPFANWELYLFSSSHWTFETRIPSAKLRMGGAWWIPLVSAGNLSVNHVRRKNMVPTGHQYHVRFATTPQGRRSSCSCRWEVPLGVECWGLLSATDLLILFEEVKSQETYGSCKEPLSSERWDHWDGRIKSNLSWWKEQMVQIWHSVSWSLKSRVWCGVITFGNGISAFFLGAPLKV